ncbi:MAG: DUF1287 domain-containing protein [Ponticaulis sp.]|nr:DUF1287 domain-containing protein [Ponticaulis sp.]|tara:strand:- start:809 stop:1414 length:606 start_codon:yes stop_codon:yes gene_type:complete
MLGGLFGLPFLTDWPLLSTLTREGVSTGTTELLKAARGQIGVTTLFDPAYVSLDYPGGDVPEDRGVCIDVVIRAYREAFDFDFQKAIHEDMKAHFSAYPKTWGLTRTDRNIDHRRVPNLETWLSRRGHELELTGWEAGDLMTCRLGGSLPHVVIVSAPSEASATILKVIHNIGLGTHEEWLPLKAFTDFRRFRFVPDVPKT